MSVKKTQLTEFKDEKGQVLLTLDLQDKTRPATVRIARCSRDQLLCLGEAAKDAAEMVDKCRSAAK